MLRVRKNHAVVPPNVVPRERARGAEACPLNRVMDLLGAAWAPHIVWYLSAQPRRFSELRIDIPVISPRVLSQRLRELEAKQVITRTVVATTPQSVEYALTELGRELLPALAAIVEVGMKLGDARPRTLQPRARG
jgi:DNA-binding HxlR family transcriptional regulator